MSCRFLILALGVSACGGSLLNSTEANNSTDTDAEGTANLVIDPTVIDFGEVSYSASESENLTLQNTGTAAVSIESVECADSQFVANGGAGLEIGPGLSTTITLTFTPSGYTASEAIVTLTSTDPDEPEVEIAVSGSVIMDGDGDGYDSIDAGGEDCDDDDATVYPDAPDEWYDGVDSNCDDANEYDQDGDGYETDVYNDDAEDGGGDCQDANDEINPAAEDVWYDGIDSDCDGAEDYDQDGDGYDSEEYGGGLDCDDLDADISPDSTEMLNGMDDDCDGEVDQDISGAVADLTIYGTSGQDRTGYALTLGDIDGDGAAEIIVGSNRYSSGRGAFAVLDGSDLPSDGDAVDDGANFVQGEGSVDNLGTIVSFYTDYDGDGDPDVGVGAPYANAGSGTLYVLPGEDAMDGGDLDDATLILSGSSASGSSVGQSVSQNLDLDGDGLDDLFGSYKNTSDQNSLWLLYGGTTGTVDVSEVDARYTGAGSDTNGDPNFPAGGDVNGDGYDDALYCDYLGDVENNNDGGVWVLWGSSTQLSNSTEEEWDTVASPAAVARLYDRLGMACGLGDDVDGDGDVEVWSYSPGYSSIFMVDGGTDLEIAPIDVEDATYTYELGSSDPAAVTLRTIGDWDGDGISEVASGQEAASSSGGTVYVFSSQQEAGTYTASKHSFGVISGDIDSDQAEYGFAISAIPGDIDGDGTVDFLVGDPGYGATGSENQGAFYVTFGLPE